MKNNFITKIIGATLAFAMMIGGAVGINVAKQAKEVNAATSTYSAKTYNAGNITGTGVTWTGNDVGGSSYVVLKSGASLTSNGFTGIDLSQNVSFTIKTRTYGGASYKTSSVRAYSDSQFSVDITGTAATVNAGGSSFANQSANLSFANNASASTVYFKITSSTTSAANGPGISEISFTYTQATGGATPLTNPAPQYNDSTKQVSWTTDAHASKYQVKVDSGEYSDINTETYDASGLTTGVPHTVYIKAVSNSEDYSSTEGSVTFTPTAPFVSKTYALCTSVNDLEAGESYIITSGITGSVQTMSNASETNYRPLANVTVTDSKITSTSNVLTLTLGGSSGAWTFHTENYAGTDGYLAPASGASNQLRVENSASEATISFNDSAAIITFTSRNDRNIIRYNSSDTRFACYSSGQASVYLWKEDKQLDHLNVAGELAKTSYYDSETFDSTGLTISAVYTNSSSRVLPANAIVWQTLVAGMTQIRGSYTELGITKYTDYFSITVTADTLSAVTLSGAMGTTYFTNDEWSKGTLAVTATYASGSSNVVTDAATIAFYSDSAMQNEVATPGDLGAGADQTIYVKATYEGVSNTTGYAQTVTVTVEHGSVSDDPLTVAEAVAKGNQLAHNAQTPKQYYIQGTVSRIDDNKLGQEGNYVFFWLQNGEETEGFEVYNITPAAGCANYNDMKVGAEVLIRCQIKRYSSTIETGTAKSLISISYTAPTLTSISLNKASLFLAVGEDEQLTASPAPIGAELGTVTWKSSNTSVATVDQEGNVSAVASGSATITAFIDENDNGSVDGGEINATCSVTVNCKATMKYESDTTTNMVASENATTVNLDSNMFAVDANKGGNQNFPGLNKDDEIRLYSGNDVIVTINSNYTITSAVFTFNGVSSYMQVYVGNALVSGSENAYAINSNSFKIHANGGQIKIISVDIFYRDATATEKVNRLDTRNTLSYTGYHAGENDTFTYDNLAIRFGGLINKDLWDALDTNEHLIQGYGVMISYEDLAGETFESYYNQSKAGNTVEETIDFIFDNDGLDGDADDGLIFGKDYYFPLSNEKTHPAEATASQKAGQPEGTYYIWNLYKNVSMANAAKEYFAVAYIRVGDELVFLTQTSASTSSLASDLINSGAYADDAFGGSLAYLASL